MMRQLSAVVSIVVLMIAAPVTAQEVFTKAIGGKGGKQFVIRCQAGTALTGVYVLAGAYVNNMGPVCDGKRMQGAGGVGERSLVECPAGSVIRKMQVVSLRSDNHLVKALTLHCFARNGMQKTAEIPLETPGRYTGFYPTDYADCGTKNGIGIQGRSGVSVDAVGLICR